MRTTPATNGLLQAVCIAMGAVGMALALTIAHYLGVTIW